jgi:S-adenosylmethionine hydrolase
MSIVALLSDFGTQGPYVGLMKAEVLRHAPKACLIDITHEVSPFCILEGAFLLAHAWSYFPKDTVFLAVVDPGVGTSRPALVLKAHQRTFIGPDNGLFSGVIQEGPIEALYAIDLGRLEAYGPVSKTFHGRDVFARAAGLWLQGEMSLLKPLGDPPAPLPELSPIKTKEGVQGRIAHVDRFGNLITTIPCVEGLRGDGHESPIVRLGGAVITQRVECYSQGNPSFPFFLQSSFGTLEVAMKERSAQDLLGVGLGDEVILAES